MNLTSSFITASPSRKQPTLPCKAQIAVDQRFRCWLLCLGKDLIRAVSTSRMLRSRYRSCFTFRLADPTHSHREVLARLWFYSGGLCIDRRPDAVDVCLSPILIMRKKLIIQRYWPPEATRIRSFPKLRWTNAPNCNVQNSSGHRGAGGRLPIALHRWRTSQPANGAEWKKRGRRDVLVQCLLPLCPIRQVSERLRANVSRTRTGCHCIPRKRKIAPASRNCGGKEAHIPDPARCRCQDGSAVVRPPDAARLSHRCQWRALLPWCHRQL